jgi:hypothetical protein
MEYFSDHDFSISRQAIADHLRDAEWNVRAQSRAEPLLRDDLGQSMTPRGARKPSSEHVLDGFIRTV